MMMRLVRKMLKLLLYLLMRLYIDETLFEIKIAGSFQTCARHEAGVHAALVAAESCFLRDIGVTLCDILLLMRYSLSLLLYLCMQNSVCLPSSLAVRQLYHAVKSHG